jgi:c-di-GMP-binding flagellar brake protein YcgR
MFLDTQPAPLDGMDEFRVQASKEVASLLKALLDGNVPVHLSGANGSHYSTVLWTMDSARGTLSFSADAGAPQLQQLLEASEASAVAYLDSVKLQFDLQGLVLLHGNATTALQAELPRELFRFQRRGAFRVRTLPTSAPVAQLRHPAIPDMALQLRVLDLSVGGCALFLPDDVPPLPAGVSVPVTVRLDATTRIDATLVLAHVTAINPQSGGVRLGCELRKLGGEAERLLQRYIDQMQKRRRLLSLE